MANNKKGVSDLAGILAMGAAVAIGFVIFIVILTLGGSLVTSMQTSQTNNTTGYWAAGNGTAGILQLSGQSTNIGLVIGIVIILTILIGGLGFFLYNRQTE